LGVICKKYGKHDTAMEWFQRAIYSKEEQGGMDKSPVCYINIGYILVESAKHEIDKLEHIKQKNPAIRLQIFLELGSLLELCKSHLKLELNYVEKMMNQI